MDRVTVYSGAVPLETDILSTNKNAMMGLGYLAQDLLGVNNVFYGLPCTQTIVASLAVLVGAGRAYSLQNVDGTAYSSLAADTTHQVVKQGILLDAVTLATVAPVTAGFSINYLIQAQYQDVDTNLVTLPYYNAANPAVAFSGPGGAGTPQATLRQGSIVVSAKAGIAAATGSQTTPAPDAGYTGLYVVTVANGQATVLAGNISVYTAAPFSSGSFTGTLTGCATSPTGTVKWVKNGSLVTAIVPVLTATSNAITCAITGMPANLFPSTIQSFGIAALLNNSVLSSPGGIQVDLSGNLNLFVNGSAASFTNSGTKGISSISTVSWLVGV